MSGFPRKGLHREQSFSEGLPLGSPLFSCPENLISSSIRNKFQVCFWPGCCLLTLAFCESACCHGDHHLDNSSEQGVVKWMKRTHSTMHSGAGRVPVRLQYHCWVAVTLGCHKASQSLLGSPLYFSIFSEYVCLLLLTCPRCVTSAEMLLTALMSGTSRVLGSHVYPSHSQQDQYSLVSNDSRL